MKWMGKKVYLILDGNRTYSGIIEAVNDCGNGLIFLELKDRFGKTLMFSTKEIKQLKEESAI